MITWFCAQSKLKSYIKSAFSPSKSSTFCERSFSAAALLCFRQFSTLGGRKIIFICSSSVAFVDFDEKCEWWRQNVDKYCADVGSTHLKLVPNCRIKILSSGRICGVAVPSNGKCKSKMWFQIRLPLPHWDLVLKKAAIRRIYLLCFFLCSFNFWNKLHDDYSCHPMGWCTIPTIDETWDRCTLRTVCFVRFFRISWEKHV